MHWSTFKQLLCSWSIQLKGAFDGVDDIYGNISQPDQVHMLCSSNHEAPPPSFSRHTIRACSALLVPSEKAATAKGLTGFGPRQV